MDKIDFTSDKFIFISNPDQYYIEGHPAQCDGDISRSSKFNSFREKR